MTWLGAVYEHSATVWVACTENYTFADRRKHRVRAQRPRKVDSDMLARSAWNPDPRLP